MVLPVPEPVPDGGQPSPKPNSLLDAANAALAERIRSHASPDGQRVRSGRDQERDEARKEALFALDMALLAEETTRSRCRRRVVQAATCAIVLSLPAGALAGLTASVGHPELMTSVSPTSLGAAVGVGVVATALGLRRGTTRRLKQAKVRTAQLLGRPLRRRVR